MTTRYLVVIGVADGWVLFAEPGSTDVALRRTVETHEMVIGHPPKIGDAHPFRCEAGPDGQTFHYYAAPNVRKRSQR